MSRVARSVNFAAVMAMALGLCGGLLLAWPSSARGPAENASRGGAASVKQTAAQEAAAQLEEVMADPLFSRWRQRQARATETAGDGWVSRYVERWSDWLGDLLDWMFRDRSPRSSGGSGFDLGGGASGLLGMLKALGWVLVIATVGLILWMLAGWMRTQRGTACGGVPTRANLDTAMEQRDALAANAEAWVAHAQQLADEQDLRQAFRAVFLALLSGLHSAGRIRYRPQRTNWAYVQGFRGDATQRDAFHGLTQRFDDVWYGHHQPHAGEFVALKSQVARLLRETGDPNGSNA